MTTQIKVSKKITRKLSIASGLLSFAAFVIQGLGQTWGFDAIAQQLTQTALLFSGAIGIYFLGDTTRKNLQESEEKKNEETK